MQNEGTVRFVKEHRAPVKGVAFSPTDRYLFTSGSNDGRINVYNASYTSSHSLVVSYQLHPTFGLFSSEIIFYVFLIRIRMTSI